MRKAILAVFMIWGFSLQAQQPVDVFDYENPNLAYLEFLTWNQINELRQERLITPLQPDSLLLQASRDHVNYINKTGKQSHFQKEEKAKADPQLRIEFYGCEHVLAGENILYLPAEEGISVRMKDGNVELRTYQQYAEAMADIWQNSKPHYANILSKDFEIAALTLSYSKERHALYAVQVFGQIVGPHPRTLSSTDFPYFELPEVQKKN